MTMRDQDWRNINYFVPREWAQDPNRVAKGLVYTMDKVRLVAGCPVVIHEAYAEDGHSEGSYHYVGLAVDFHFKGLSYIQQFVVLSSFTYFGCIIFNPHWNSPGWHVDGRCPLDIESRLIGVFCQKKGRYIYGHSALSKALNKMAGG